MMVYEGVECHLDELQAALKKEGRSQEDVNAMCAIALETAQDVSEFLSLRVAEYYPCVNKSHAEGESGHEHPEAIEAMVLGFGLMLETWSQTSKTLMARKQADELLEFSRLVKVLPSGFRTAKGQA
jgi:hypothetical protein